MPRSLEDEVVVQAFGTAKKKDLTGADQLDRLETDQLTIQLDAVACTRGRNPRYCRWLLIDGQPGVRTWVSVSAVSVPGPRTTRIALIVIDGVPYSTNSNVAFLVEPERYRIDHGIERCRFDRPVGFARRQRRRDGNDQERPAGARQSDISKAAGASTMHGTVHV